VDLELAERVYREEKIPHAIHVPIIKHAVELNPSEKRPDVFGVSFRACRHDNTHWFQTYDRGQPGFFTVDNEPRRETIETVKESNAFIYRSVRTPLGEEAIRKLDADYHQTAEAYRAIAQKRMELLRQSDEFNGNTLDATKWWVHNPDWYDRGPAMYLPENIAMKDGELQLTLRKDQRIQPFSPYKEQKQPYAGYSAASVTSKTMRAYGCSEIRAKVADSITTNA
jgi:hypothetical protein